MKVTCEKEPLARALAVLAKAVEKRTSIPILGNVRLDYAGAVLSITGTDLDIYLTAHVGAEPDSAVEASATVPYEYFARAVKAVAKGESVGLSFPVSDTGPVVMNAGRSEYELPTLPVSDFPEGKPWTPVVTLDYDSATFRDGLEFVRGAVSTEETRYYLNGVAFDWVSDHVRLVATDGHRLALRELNAAPFTGAWPTETGNPVIVPRKSIDVAREVLKGDKGVCRLSFGTEHAMLVAGAFTMRTRMIDGTFPDYRRIIPDGSETKTTLEVDSAEFKETVNRLDKTAPADATAVKISVNGGVDLTRRSPEGYSVKERLACRHSGGNLEIGVNCRYLADAIKHFDGPILARLSDAASPFTLEVDSAARMVVMPMRV